ncbi:MAG: hypothetical protein NC918_00040 [Candidatus Omnitrophica bacterium]|nr:hypothetical protein [Candidatus Omnitrophota bacterium]
MNNQIINTLNKINKILILSKKSFFNKLVFLFIFLIYLNFGQDPTQELTNQLNSLCKSLQDLIPTMAMLLVVFAAFAYAGGQFFSAETRARASAWASSCIAGALIGILLSQILPLLLGAIIGQDITCN